MQTIKLTIYISLQIVSADVVETLYLKFRQSLIDTLKDLKIPYNIDSLTKIRHECFRRNMEQKDLVQPMIDSVKTNLITDQQTHYVQVHQLSSSSMSSQTCTQLNEFKIVNQEEQTIYTTTMSSLQLSGIPATSSTTTTNIMSYNEGYNINATEIPADQMINTNIPVFYIASSEPISIELPPIANGTIAAPLVTTDLPVNQVSFFFSSIWFKFIVFGSLFLYYLFF